MTDVAIAQVPDVENTEPETVEEEVLRLTRETHAAILAIQQLVEDNIGTLMEKIGPALKMFGLG